MGRALLWLDGMSIAEVKPTLVSFNVLAGSCARQGDVDSLARVLDLMTQSTLDPNVVTWTSMITACANADPPRDHAAERVFRQMVSSGVKPNGQTAFALKCAVGFNRSRDLLREV